MLDLGIQGRTALVTAASRGIGRACAFNLAREGANVVICARGEEDLHHTANAIASETGASVLSQTADVTSSEDIERLVAAAKDRFGPIDILVAIGGSPRRGSFLEVNETQYLEAFEMTVMMLVRLVAIILPDMRRRAWGRIVTVQARSVREPIPDLALSNATRPGAAGLIKHLSNEFARDGVLLNCVLPGRIITDRLREAAERSSESPERFFKSQAAELPIGRLGEAQEVADAVAYLCSDRASYITGVSLAVDGGLIHSI